MISGKTKITGIFGDPIEHTLSPLLHNSAFRELGLDYCYIPFLVKAERLKEAVEAIRALNLIGVNITVPHKEAVIPYLDEIKEEAKYIEAVNTILNSNGKLIGFNTDVYGFINSIFEEGVTVKGSNILLLGAGGAAKAVAFGILKEGGNLFLFNRTLSKAYKLKETFQKLGSIEIIKKITPDIMRNFQIVVNATSLGLRGNDPMPLEPTLLIRDHVYIDLIYNETPLLKEAKKFGCKTIDGSGMLIWQAAKAFEIWTGKAAPLQMMKKIFKEKKTIDKNI